MNASAGEAASGATDRESPVFVVGVPRSGTTLLSEILSAHPELVISPETFYFLDFGPRLDRAGARTSTEARRAFLDEFVRSPGIQDMDLDPDRLDATVDALLEPGEVTHAEILSAFLEAYAEEHDADRWGEKTPAHLRKVPEILSAFPDATVVCIVRDPRDVIRSQIRHEMDDRNLAGRARRWSFFGRLSDRWQDRFPERFAEFRYEDLLRRPRETVEAVCEHVDLSFTEAMLTYHESESATFDPEREPKKTKATRPLDPDNAEKWRDEMPPRQAKIVEVLCRRGMADRGYPATPEPLTPGIAAEAARQWLTDVAYRTGHNLAWWAGHWLTPPDFDTD